MFKSSLAKKLLFEHIGSLGVSSRPETSSRRVEDEVEDAVFKQSYLGAEWLAFAHLVHYV